MAEAPRRWRRRAGAIAGVSAILWLTLVATTLQVGGEDGYATIGAALAAARPGDTVVVRSGEYREHLVIQKPVVLLGQGRPVIDGGGNGTVITVLAPSVVRGLRVRGSGSSLDAEDAGILVRADSSEISDNVLEDVLFGIYLKESDGVRVSGNRITGKDRPLGVRGDGIRLWYSHDDVIEHNRIDRVRDVVVFFSHGLTFRYNRVTNGRYGLHYMYSDHNTFEHNEFIDNDVSAFLMYSTDIRLSNNIFARASGRSGFGIGLKDADRITATHNLIVQNQVGIYLDNSPSREDVVNRFQDNVLAFNDVAVTPLPSVRSNDFAENTFRGNLREVMVSGGGSALANDWRLNSWDQAMRWDEDGDGIADRPFRVDRLSDDLLARHPELRLFEMSPAAAALDALARFFPLLEPQPLLVDSAPRLEAGGASGSIYGLGDRGSGGGGSPVAALVCLALVAVSIWGAWRWPL